MKLRIASSILLFALAAPVLAGHAPMVVANPYHSGQVYAGIFGGGAWSDDINAVQFGTALFPEISGGPLSVNAFGQLGSQSSGFYGLQLGYKAPGIFFMPCAVWPSSQWSIGPAVELEGYTMNDSTFSGSFANNTSRLPVHDFDISYEMSRNVYLANLVFGLDNPCFLLHPYVGFGIGSGIVRISGAQSTQVVPPEPGVNHFGASTSDTSTTFAGQFKVGVSYDFTDYFSVFADYRWLYLGNTKFVLGSTISPGHAETTAWQMNMDPQRYNMLDVGLRFTA